MSYNLIVALEFRSWGKDFWWPPPTQGHYERLVKAIRDESAFVHTYHRGLFYAKSRHSPSQMGAKLRPLLLPKETVAVFHAHCAWVAPITASDNAFLDRIWRMSLAEYSTWQAQGASEGSFGTPGAGPLGPGYSPAGNLADQGFTGHGGGGGGMSGDGPG